MEMQQSRSALQGQSLSSVSSTSEAVDTQLSLAQVKRLNNARLDRTLDAFAKHPVWSQGLGISDHISALKASLVLSTDTDKSTWREWRVEHSNAFSYNPKVIPTPKPLPAFMRGCYTLHAGVCEQLPHFEILKELVTEFDRKIQNKKMGTEPFLAHLELAASAGCRDTPPGTWLIVAGVCQRPLCHSVIHLHRSGNCLQWSVKDGNLHVGTMHRALSSTLASHVASGGQASEASINVPRRSQGSCEIL